MSRWFIETRLAWIKESIEIFGFLNREHIVKKFEVSIVQASTDIRMARERWPHLMEYDTREKVYRQPDQGTLVRAP